MANQDLLRSASAAVAAADALVIGAGAGMGVDSGLPDFRGAEGFWRAYPLYQKLGLDFASMANPRWFESDPAFAWGFYGHRLDLYRRTAPHQGFAILRRWAARMKYGAFVITSNVDGQFQKAGFDDDRVVEIHGSIHLVQCARCGQMLRPNILMFGDGWWDSTRSDAQEARLGAWLTSLGDARVVVVECGAGTAIPSVRILCERLLRKKAALVRINPREPEVPPGGIGVAMGALEALRGMDEDR